MAERSTKRGDAILAELHTVIAAVNCAVGFQLEMESQLPWFDIHDDLPRTRSEESPTLSKAWESVGVMDRAHWK